MKTTIVALFGEIRKGLLTAWTYRVNSFFTLITVGFVFLGIVFVMGGGTIDSDEFAITFLGYLTWFYALSAIGDLSWGIRGEINAGTLEQMAMSPAPVGLILIGRIFSSFVISTAQMLIQIALMTFLLHLRIPMTREGVLVLVLTLIGIFGFGFILAGATLVFKQVESLANLIQNALLFLNGTILPIESMPGWLATIARTIPSTQGIVVLRRLVLDEESLGATWRDGSLVWLIVHSVLYFTIGWTTFGLCERTAKAQGSLGQY